MKTYLTFKELDTIIEKIPFLRDKLLFRLLSRTGIRISELLGIKVEDIDFEDKVISIIHLKKRTENDKPNYRLIAVDDETLKIAKGYIQKLSLGPKDKLISMTRQNAYYLLRIYADYAGYGGKLLRHPESGRKHFLSPHKFRDALAVHWLMKDGSMEGAKSLQEQLGHKNMNTTMRYFKLSIDNVKKVYKTVME